MQALFTKDLSRTQINWLKWQNFTEKQLNSLLNYLNKNSFSASYAVVSVLADSKGKYYLTQLENFLSASNEHNALFYAIQYILLQTGRITIDVFFASIFSIQYEDKNSFIIIRDLFKPIHALLKDSSHVTEKHKVQWSKKLYSMALKAVRQREHKYEIENLIIELVMLKIESKKMDKLLKIFLSKEVDSQKFWYENAISSCFSNLSAYFSEACADYLVYKINHGAKLSQLIDDEFVKNITCDNARILLINTLLNIYQVNFVDIKDKIDFRNPVFYIKNLDPALVLRVVLKDLIESKIMFLNDYLRVNGYALTIHDDSVRIYMPSGIIMMVITYDDRQKLIQRPRGDLTLPNGVTVEEQSRSPSPTFFLFDYAGAVANRHSFHTSVKINEITIKFNSGRS